MEPTIVNFNTGFVVGGHQRLSILDEIKKYNPENHRNDYEIVVSYVELSDAEELKALVFLNNPSAQGQWDLDGLANLNIDLGVPFADMGFDPIDVQIMFDGDPRFVSGFETEPQVKDEAQKAAEIASIKESKKAARERWKDQDSTAFYVRVYGRDQAQIEEFLGRIKLPLWETDISVDSILEALDGIRPTSPDKEQPKPDQSGTGQPDPVQEAEQEAERLKVAKPKAKSRKASQKEESQTGASFDSQ